ncbi:MAG TPA: hypothetical protein VFG76_06800 [Candidatus Polarisedimenticolia bacterium]|nr:hypothetical protein [Candidatus Polarisedimenticolia bacterium]
MLGVFGLEVFRRRRAQAKLARVQTAAVVQRAEGESAVLEERSKAHEARAAEADQVAAKSKETSAAIDQDVAGEVAHGNELLDKWRKGRQP